MIEKFRPEIQRELMNYNSQSSENIEKAIDSVLARYSKKNPLIGMLLPELKEKAAEDIREKDRKG